MRKLKRIDQSGNSRQGVLQFALCLAALIVAVILAVVSVTDYCRSVEEKNSLTKEVKETRAEKEEVIANNTILRNEVRHLKTKVKNAKEDLKNVSKIPKRIQKIDELTESIGTLGSKLADLNEEIEALRSQLPPGTVLETDE